MTHANESPGFPGRFIRHESPLPRSSFCGKRLQARCFPVKRKKASGMHASPTTQLLCEAPSGAMLSCEAQEGIRHESPSHEAAFVGSAFRRDAFCTSYSRFPIIDSRRWAWRSSQRPAIRPNDSSAAGSVAILAMSRQASAYDSSLTTKSSLPRAWTTKRTS